MGTERHAARSWRTVRRAVGQPPMRRGTRAKYGATNRLSARWEAQARDCGADRQVCRAEIRLGLPFLFDPVIRGFLGDDHVVNVAFAQAGGGDPQEARLFL